MLKQKAQVVAQIVFGVDLVLTSVAFFAAFFIRDLFLPVVDPVRFPTGLFPLVEYLKIYPLVLIIWSVLLFSYNSYHSHRTIPLTREALTTIRVVFVGNVLLATLAYLLPLRQLSRSWFILFVLIGAVLLVAEKVLVRVLARWVRSKGLNYRTVLIVGTGRRATDIARMIVGHKYWGYKILGFVSDGHRLSNGWARYRIYGNVPDMKRILEAHEIGEPIDEVVFAVTRKKLDEMQQIFIMCEELGIRTRMAMNIFQNRVARLELEELEGVPFLTFTTTPSNETQLALKRALDVAVSLLVLALAGPAIGIAALAIRSTSPGSVLFKQKRIASAAMPIIGPASASNSSETITSSARLSASCVSFDGVVVNVRNGTPSSSSSSRRATRFWKIFIATRVRMPSSSHMMKICFISSSFLRVTANTTSSIGSPTSCASRMRFRSGTLP